MGCSQFGFNFDSPSWKGKWESCPTNKLCLSLCVTTSLSMIHENQTGLLWIMRPKGTWGPIISCVDKHRFGRQAEVWGAALVDISCWDLGLLIVPGGRVGKERILGCTGRMERVSCYHRNDVLSDSKNLDWFWIIVEIQSVSWQQKFRFPLA